MPKKIKSEFSNISCPHWEFTLNNYTDKEIEHLKKISEEVKFMRVAKEIGEKKGTPHLQGRIIFNGNKRLAGLKKLNKRIRWEPTKDTKDALYMVKLEGEIIIDIDRRQQGKRTDVINYVNAIKEGKRDIDLINEFPREFLKFSRTDKMRLIIEKSKTRQFRNVQVIVHWGATGTGKTRIPYEEGAYLFRDWEKFNWDGYDGEDVICLDEFYGQAKTTWLQEVLDGYQLRLNQKYGGTWAKYTKVYITSNVSPKEWYSNGNVPEEVKLSILRRISKFVEFKANGIKIETSNL